MSQTELNFLKNLKILFAEDEDIARENISQILRYYSDYIYEAKDGIEAWRKYQEIEPDIFITDINMPNIDGLEISYKIREGDNRVRILILTAYTDTDFLLKATELSLTKYIVKPINRKKFISAISKATKELLEREKKESKFYLRDGYFFDFEKIALFRESKEIKLTKKEILLLRELIKLQGNLLTFERIEVVVWEGEMSSIYSIRTLVKLLKRKLYKDAIENIRGVGYRLNF